MPNLKWKICQSGGKHCLDKHGNYWHLAEDGMVTIIAADDRTVKGPTPELAWRALQEGA